MNKSAKYDNDFVTLKDLKKYINENGEFDETLKNKLPKSYTTPPSPPYSVGDVLYYNHSIYRCISDRKQGTFNWSDWFSVATDNETLNNWIEFVYAVDKLQLEEQIDKKIETFYQATDPNTWTTNIEKAKHVGDYWYRTTDNTQWRYTALNTNPVTYGWQQVNVPDAIFDLIDTKKTIYTAKPTSYKKDDLWIIESDLPDGDLPVGTIDNPIAKGDWVFSLQDSNSYNKNHWVKRDMNVTLEYIQNHYYTTTEIEAKITEINRTTDSKISQAKDEISLSVSQNYTTKTEFNQKVLDYDEEIGEITTTVVDHSEAISNLSVDVNSISSTVYENNERITDALETYKEQVSTEFEQTKNDFTFSFNSTKELIDAATDTENAHYEELHRYIRFISGVIVLGEQGNPLSAELSNNKLSFKQNGYEVAYISNNKLYITNAEILTEIIIGNFAFVPRSNGSLSFRKVR